MNGLSWLERISLEAERNYFLSLANPCSNHSMDQIGLCRRNHRKMRKRYGFFNGSVWSLSGNPYTLNRRHPIAYDCYQQIETVRRLSAVASLDVLKSLRLK